MPSTILKTAALAALLASAAVAQSSCSAPVVPNPRPTVTIGPKPPFQPIPTSPARNGTICVVPTNNDLVTDTAPAILAAMQACNNGGTVVFPSGDSYLIGTALDLTFLEHIDIDIQGYILFSNDTTYWQANAFYQTYQNATTFWEIGGIDVNVYGGGTIDGNGQVWYDLYAVDDLILRPVLMGVIGLTDGLFADLYLRNSPQWFHFVANSTNIVFDNINIFSNTTDANPDSNTDGWDVYRTNNVVIQNSVIVNDDDCVSFKPNTTNIVVQGLSCTNSHGISVGSLGQYVGEYDIVENVLVYNNTMIDCATGARIKVWPGDQAQESGDLSGGGGSGMVSNVTYDTMTIVNTDYAIEVTQCYGQSNLTLCYEYPASLTITDVLMTNFAGTVTTEYGSISGYVVCSSEDVCTNITLTDIDVVAPDGTVNLFTCGDVDEALLQGINCTTELTT